MEKTNFRFDEEKNEVFFESKLQDRKLCVWMDITIYNNLLPDEIEDICKVIFNITVNVDEYTLGKCAISFGKKNMIVEYCVDEQQTINIDNIQFLNESEFEIVEIEMKSGKNKLLN